MDNFNKDTLGVAINDVSENYVYVTESLIPSYYDFGYIINVLSNGGVVTRSSWGQWEKNPMVFKQVPSTVPKEFVEKMSSLSENTIRVMKGLDITPSYKNQLVIMTVEGDINSWTPTADDIFADDWMVVN